jgi:hypothetical protein
MHNPDNGFHSYEPFPIVGQSEARLSDNFSRSTWHYYLTSNWQYGSIGNIFLKAKNQRLHNFIDTKACVCASFKQDSRWVQRHSLCLSANPPVGGEICE